MQCVTVKSMFQRAFGVIFEGGNDDCLVFLGLSDTAGQKIVDFY